MPRDGFSKRGCHQAYCPGALRSTSTVTLSWKCRTSARRGNCFSFYARLTSVVLLLVCVLVSAVSFAQEHTRNEEADPIRLARDGIVEIQPSADAAESYRKSGELALRYTFATTDLIFVLSENGFLHAFDIANGNHTWSADVGGDMMRVQVELPPTAETIVRDPLALPFLVRGNSLFTRMPFYTYSSSPAALGTAELGGHLPDVLRPYFFMNISTLLRRKAVLFDDTDILVTTSVEVADLDSVTGWMVSRQHKGKRSAASVKKEAPPSASSFVPSSSRTPSSVLNELVPLLHVVRYNIVIDVLKTDEYSWSITLSQLQLSPRVPTSSGGAGAARRHFWSAADTTPPASTEEPEEDESGRPRFFSHVMRDLFDYDAVHTRNHTAEVKPERADASASSTESTTVGPTTGFPVISTNFLKTVQRRRSQAAVCARHMLSIQHYNGSHIRLQNLLDGTSVWTATVPSLWRDAEGEEETAAGFVSAPLASARPLASYVWLSGADRVVRIPVERVANETSLYMAPGDVAGEEAYSEGSAQARQRRWGSSAMNINTAVAHPRAQGSLGNLQLIPYLDEAGKNAVSHALLAMDVEGDEREGEELDQYYLERSWWEPQFLSAPSPREVEEAGGGSGGDGGASYPGFTSPGEYVVRTGLAWRTAGVISFHVLCLAGSIAFLCAGVPPRGQLQRAWAQADRNRDRLLHVSVSRPQSTQLVPQDLLPSAAATFSGRFAGGPNFSPATDAFSMDSPAVSGLPGSLTASVRPCLPRPDDGAATQESVPQPPLLLDAMHSSSPPPPPSPPLHQWGDPTPEEVYAMMREEQEEKTLLPPPTSNVNNDEAPSVTAAVTATLTSVSDGTKMWLANVADASTETTTNATTQGSPCMTVGHNTLDVSTADLLPNTTTGTTMSASSTSSSNSSGSSSSDDDSEDIDLGERWWLRAQHNPNGLSSLTPAAAAPAAPAHTVAPMALEDGASDDGNGSTASSLQKSSSTNNKAVEEEGKLFQLHFKVLKKIGFGGEGSVFCVEHRVTHAQYAIKVIHIHEQDEERVVQEAVLHSSFDNANVVRFYFCWIEDIAVSTVKLLNLCSNEDGMDTMSMGYSERSLQMSSSADETFTGRYTDDCDESVVGSTYHMLFIQMEYFPRGTLDNWLRDRKGFYRLEVLLYMQHIANGLAYLHNQDVVHRDLKPTNMFVSNDNVLKIGDFGLAKRRGISRNSTGDLASNVMGCQQERSVVGGSPLYCSPEQTRGDLVNKSSDIFSFGIIAVEMLCTFTTLHERIRILTDAHNGILPPELESDYPNEVHIIKPMLAHDPARRPPIRKVQRDLTRLVVALEEAEEEDAEDGTASPPLDGTETPSSRHHSLSYDNSNLIAVSGAAGTAAAAFVAPSHHSNEHGATPAAASPSTHSSSMRRVTVNISDGKTLADRLAAASRDSLYGPTSASFKHALPVDPRASSSPVTLSSAPMSHLDSQQAVGPGAARDSSSAHPSNSGGGAKHGNFYRNRHCGSTSPGHAADISSSVSSSNAVSLGGGATYGGHMNGSTGGVPSSPPEPIVTDPYGLPTTPITYSGDANLSTILKRDLETRVVSPPD